jgi:hypothetical protein
VSRESEHIEFEELNDYLDGRLDGRATTRLEEHVRACAQCSAELDELRSLLSSVASLPRTMLPADDIWADLKASIDERKQVMLPVVGGAGRRDSLAHGIRRIPWRTQAFMAIAAVLLVVVSSGITTLVLRRGGETEEIVLPESVGAAPMLPASFRVAEGKYITTIDELKVAFEAQRGSLNPQTVRTVEHSLSVIDSAISEARDALLADPGNRTLVDLLSASYQRKLDLLRRSSELTPRT